MSGGLEASVCVSAFTLADVPEGFGVLAAAGPAVRVAALEAPSGEAFGPDAGDAPDDPDVLATESAFVTAAGNFGSAVTALCAAGEGEGGPGGRVPAAGMSAPSPRPRRDIGDDFFWAAFESEPEPVPEPILELEPEPGSGAEPEPSVPAGLSVKCERKPEYVVMASVPP